ncbi:SHOCT domain-containing protein [Candidatus Pelagibacter sp.]|jgi:predicted Zn-dependent peptidase|nr:SHOCT domain-containing protein [Candidatus Pelagibacter sp.]|tara:strand:- start:411 stop:677 length:267 start_codon:yes stop_codon:yes gene_type:complete
METIIFFGLVIPIFLFVLYLGGRAIMTGFSAKSSNKSDAEIETNENIDNIANKPENLTEELNKLNELLKSGALTQEEFEKAKKKILDN